MSDRPGRVGLEIAAMLGESRSRSGRPIVSLEQASSTNDVARRLAVDGAAHGTLVVADGQTAGRGRLGRAWSSPLGLGLWCTLVIRPKTPLSGLGALPLAVALAVARAILAAAGFRCGVKWPNDLVADHRKLGGVLSEASGAGAASLPPDFVLAGVGVNVCQRAGDFPEDLRGRASSLLLEGLRTTPAEIGAAFVREFDIIYRAFEEGGFGALRDEWVSLATVIGVPVRVCGAGREVRGIAVGVDEQGRLLLRTPSGENVAVAAGDVSLRPDRELDGEREGPWCSA